VLDAAKRFDQTAVQSAFEDALAEIKMNRSLRNQNNP